MGDGQRILLFIILSQLFEEQLQATKNLNVTILSTNQRLQWVQPPTFMGGFAL